MTLETALLVTTASMLAELRAGLESRLPIACRAVAVCLYRERDDGTWCEHAAYPLGRG